MADVLVKIMRISPLIMFSAEIFCKIISFTKAVVVTSCWHLDARKNASYFFKRIFSTMFSILPSIIMMSHHVFGICFKKFKIFNSVISSNTVNMMHPLVRGKLSSKVLFHYISMVKNAFSIYVYTKIPSFSKAWFPLFQVGPIRGNVITAMSKKPTSVHLANTPLCFLEDIFATFDFTNITSNHVLNYNVKGSIRQW